MQYAELFPFFDELSARGRDEFGALRPVRAKPRQELIRRGDATNGAYLVLKGALRVYYVTDEGREATLYRVTPGGACILALTATLLEQPYPAWVQAGAAGATVARVPNTAFERLMTNEPPFRSFVLDAMAGRIFELMRTLEEVTSSTVLRRVAAYLVRNAGDDGDVAVTQSRLADELGTAREVVFRALRALVARKLVTTRRGYVRVLDAAALARSAGDEFAARQTSSASRSPLVRAFARPR
jgi:CRP/FNR family transcriptional regulator